MKIWEEHVIMLKNIVCYERLVPGNSLKNAENVFILINFDLPIRLTRILRIFRRRKQTITRHLNGIKEEEDVRRATYNKNLKYLSLFSLLRFTCFAEKPCAPCCYRTKFAKKTSCLETTRWQAARSRERVCIRGIHSPHFALVDSYHWQI